MNQDENWFLAVGRATQRFAYLHQLVGSLVTFMIARYILMAYQLVSLQIAFRWLWADEKSQSNYSYLTADDCGLLKL